MKDDTMLVCSPLGHMTGFAAGMLLGVKIGATVDLPGRLGAEARRHASWRTKASPIPPARRRSSPTCARRSPPARRNRTSLRKFLCAGAPIPPALIERVYRELDLQSLLALGHDEIAVEHADGARTRAGKILEDRRPAARGRRRQGRQAGRQPGADRRDRPAHGARRTDVPGLLQTPDMEPFDAEGWFDTGDLAYMDDEGYIRINGRVKDVVIRGGENVPVVEIENLLFMHPAVLAAALVGYPDSRLGERACAFVVLRPGPYARPERRAGATWRRTRSPSSTGPNASRSSPNCPRPRPAKCRSSSCANKPKSSARRRSKAGA